MLSGICRYSPIWNGNYVEKCQFFTCVANQITAEASDYNKVHEQWCGTYNGDTNNGSMNNDSTNIGGFNSVSTNSNSIDRDDKKINRSKSCTFNIRMFSLTAAQRKRNLCNSAERLRHAFIVNCIRSNCFENQMNFTAIYFARANIKRKSQQQQHFYSIWLNILCDGLSLLFASVFFFFSRALSSFASCRFLNQSLKYDFNTVIFIATPSLPFYFVSFLFANISETHIKSP